MSLKPFLGGQPARRHSRGGGDKTFPTSQVVPPRPDIKDKLSGHASRTHSPGWFPGVGRCGQRPVPAPRCAQTVLAPPPHPPQSRRTQLGGRGSPSLTLTLVLAKCWWAELPAWARPAVWEGLRLPVHAWSQVLWAPRCGLSVQPAPPPRHPCPRARVPISAPSTARTATRTGRPGSRHLLLSRPGSNAHMNEV